MSSRSAWLSSWGYSNPQKTKTRKRPLEENVFKESVSVVSSETFAPPPPPSAPIKETLDDLAPEVAEKQNFAAPPPPSSRRKSNRLKKK